MEPECPSCGGRSFSRTGDEGGLICDACDEQLHGFRQEEMDDEDAGAHAVFTRQSQEARVETKRLNLAAADMRARARRAAPDAALDYPRELRRGVVVLVRAVVDALVASGRAPPALADAAFQVAAHWLRMWHASGRLARHLACTTEAEFRPRCVLAMVCLAAVYVRADLLPRDLCALAARGEVPYYTAAVDFLPAEAMRHPRLWTAFTPSVRCTSADICVVASAFALSEYTWPPLRAFFDGPPRLYCSPFVPRDSLCFPVGLYGLTVRRLVRLLGLPTDFPARVHRFRELRLCATAMAKKSHARYVADQNARKRRRAAAMLARNRRSDSGVYGVAGPVEGGPRQGVRCARSSALDIDAESSDGISIPSDDSVSKSYVRNSDDSDDSDDEGGAVVDAEPHEEVYSYRLRSGLSQLPFTPRIRRAWALDEFPTNRTVLLDLVATLRICYGCPESGNDMPARIESPEERHLRLAEWQFCVAAVRELLKSGGPDANDLLWAGLSPAAISTLRGNALTSFVSDAKAATEGSVPVFMADSSDAFRRIASEGQSAPRTDVTRADDGGNIDSLPKMQYHDETDAHDKTLDFSRRVGNWVWDGEDDRENARGGLGAHGNEFVDSNTSAARPLLMPHRGYTPKPLRDRKISRGLFWSSLGQGAESLWCEPADIGLVIEAATRFFAGTPANVAAGGGRDSLWNAKELAQGCDNILLTVFNYVDVYLGEEGHLGGAVTDDVRKAYTGL
jgi:hypothetical protein